MNNTRYATVIHILVLLAKSPGEWLSSEWMAASINVNPVVVRRELAHLVKRGWVTSRKGKEGGIRLAVSPAEVKLGEVYLLIRNSDVLGKRNLHPNPECPVGRKINQVLEGLSADTDEVVVTALNRQSLADLITEFE